MKNMPAIITFATVAALLLLAIAASLFNSIPFAFIASYVVGFGCSLGFLAMFIADYSHRSPRLAEIVVREADARPELEAAAKASTAWNQPDWGYRDPITVSFRSTLGLRNEPITWSAM
jgi:hypothetical protein